LRFAKLTDSFAIIQKSLPTRESKSLNNPRQTWRWSTEAKGNEKTQLIRAAVEKQP